MLTFGFYNSKGGDRKYDAEQIGAMFNGLITDGVFAHYKNALKVVPGDGNRELVISSGRAWFNGTWTEVDDKAHSIYLMGSAVETTYFVYLAVDKRDRRNSIAWYSNIANNDPEKGLYFYLLAQVTVPGGATKITDSMITDTRGSDMCPYVTGVLETVSFEDLVKQVCGDNWKDWLGVYESSITTGVQNAVAVSNRALAEVESLKSYNIETEDTSYIWAKYEAIRTGGGGFVWATDAVHTELTDPPMPMYLYRDLSFSDLGDGSLPYINLSRPYVETAGAKPKAIPASTQANVWMEYPYFWEGGNAVGKEVLRYDSLRRVIVNSGGNSVEKYTYRVSRLIHNPNVYKPGEYVGTVTADNATAYPRDGYKDGYWYKRFASKADDVHFDSPEFSSKNVRDALNELMQKGGSAPQAPEGTKVYVCTDGEYTEGGVPNVEDPGSYAYYWVPKDSDGTIYASWTYENGVWKFVEDLTVTLEETECRGVTESDNVSVLAPARTLLWENPAPDDKFAKQTITIPDAGSYDGVEVVFHKVGAMAKYEADNNYGNLSGKGCQSTGFIPVINGTAQFVLEQAAIINWTGTDTELVGHRDVKISVGNEFTAEFGTGVHADQFGDPGSFDEWCVPIYIYGVKSGQVASGGSGGGTPGKPGRGIVSIERTAGNGAAGTVDTYTITYTDGTTSTYQVRNGADGKDAPAIETQVWTFTMTDGSVVEMEVAARAVQ